MEVVGCRGVRPSRWSVGEIVMVAATVAVAVAEAAVVVVAERVVVTVAA